MSAAQQAKAFEAILDKENDFGSFGLDNRLVKAISKANFSHPTIVQSAAIPLALEGKDILARARTGSGKTAAYLLPIIQKILQEREEGNHKQGTRALILVPSAELCQQVFNQGKQLTLYAQDITFLHLSRSVPLQVQRKRIAELPDIIIATPSQIIPHLREKIIDFRGEPSLGWVVLDEADLLLSFGYEDDIKEIAAQLPKIGCQSFLMSATLATTEDLDQLKHLVLHNPAILKLEEAEQREEERLKQFFVNCPADDKLLILVVLLRLRVLRGKVLFFVQDIDNCYRLKLFLERFYVKSAVLNSELPQNTRSHIVAQFNKGIFDNLIATDERFFAGKDLKNKKKDKDYMVSRGVDFKGVKAVINVDMPKSKEAYIHRIGRTARGGATGIALTLVSPDDEPVMNEVRAHMVAEDIEITPYKFATEAIEGFRYRVTDIARSVTKAAIRDARIKELKLEMLNSDKLKSHFEDNPRDLAMLKHDQTLQHSKQQPQLKFVPKYLIKDKKKIQKATLVTTQATKPKSRKRSRRGPAKDPLKTFSFDKPPTKKAKLGEQVSETV